MPLLQRFPGLGDFFDSIREGIRHGVIEYTGLPAYARLPIIKGMVLREIDKIVAEAEPLTERLVQYDRVRTPVHVPIDQFVPGIRQMPTATVTLLMPDGRILISRVGLPIGRKVQQAELLRRLASDIGDATFPDDPQLTDKLKKAIIGIDYYVQEYRKI